MRYALALALSVSLAVPPRSGRRPAQMLQVLAPQPEGPRITPLPPYQLDLAWRQDDARRAALRRGSAPRPISSPAARSPARRRSR